MTENKAPAPAQNNPAQNASKASTGAPKTVDQANDYIAQVTAELAKRKQELADAEAIRENTTKEAQGALDSATDKAYSERREVKNRTEKEMDAVRTAQTKRIDEASDLRDEAAKQYHDAINAIVGGGLLTKALLGNLGFELPTVKPARPKLVTTVKQSDYR